MCILNYLQIVNLLQISEKKSDKTRIKSMKQNNLIYSKQQQINQQVYSSNRQLAEQMSSPQLDQSHQSTTLQYNLKQLHSLSTLAYNKTPSPLLLNTTANINLSRFKTIDITEKAKKNIASQMRNNGNNSRMNNKRNQSLGSITHKDMVNPQINQLLKLGFTNKKQTQVDYIELNKDMVKDAKAKNFLNKVFGPAKGNSPNHNQSSDSMTTTQKMDMTLPVIQHKRHSSKKANFLQQWLDQALDPQDLYPSDMKQLSPQNPLSSRSLEQQIRLQPASNYLSTVKKYQVDKQYLRSQNIPSEIIDRLYNTLFVYTYGINNVFTELLSFVKSSSGQQTRDSKIVASFWKCFVKLLEGCTSFQTSFQKVEEQYVARANELRELSLMKESELIREREELKYLITKYEKQKIEVVNKYTRLESDYKITVATLQLTDNAFNEQVQLRLKFEQKINHIYSSYEELKQKYQSIMEMLEAKNEESFQKASQQIRLKEQVRQLEGQILELQDLLAKEKAKVKERQLEVNIKKQELLDLEMSLQIRQEKEKEEGDVMENQVNKIAMLKATSDQLQNRLKMQNYTQQTLTNKVQEQSSIIEDYRRMNEQLHRKYNEASQKLVSFEAYKIYQSAQITRLTTQSTLLKQQYQITLSQKLSLESKLTFTLEQLQQAQFSVQTKNAALEDINSKIQDLKATKDKYERLWNIMEKQKIELQNQRNLIQQKYELQKEEFVGLKMLYDNREKHIKDIEVKHDKEKEMLKRKITGYNEIVTKKESLLLTYQKNEQEKADLLLKRNYRIEQLQKQLTDQKALTIRKEKDHYHSVEQVSYLSAELSKLEATLKGRGQELEKQITKVDMTHDELQSVKSLLAIVKDEQNASVTNLTTLYEDYRKLVNRKGQHVHPMIYEDLTNQYNRLKLQTIPRLQNTITGLISVKDNLERQVEDQKNTITLKNDQIFQLNQQLVHHKQTIQNKSLQTTELRQQILTLQTTIKQHQTQINKQEKTLIKKQKAITELTASLQTVTQTNSSLTHKISAKKIEIERLSSTLTQLSDKLANYETEMQLKQKQNPYLIKVEKLEKQLIQTRKELLEITKQLKILKSVSKCEQDVQTEPQGEVFICEPKLSVSSNIRKNKFFVNQNTKSQNKQVQVSLPPYDSIPQYIDSKICQINRQQHKRQQQNQSPPTFIMKSKLKDSPQHAPLNSQKSLTKLQPKEPITRREELRRALRMTYMRR